MKLIITIIGWLGVLSCTMAYLLLNLKMIRAESVTFQLLNIIGGLALMTTAIETHDLPNATVNLVWMLIGLFALVRHFRSYRQRRSKRFD